jgi:hypothetical protein
MKNGYDYAVVGGGSAGCVLAARLTENPAAQVALIEAGPMDDAPEVHTPVAFAQLFKSDHDWDYSSEPEPALFGRRIYLPRGKVLGGCPGSVVGIDPNPDILAVARDLPQADGFLHRDHPVRLDPPGRSRRVPSGGCFLKR